MIPNSEFLLLLKKSICLLLYQELESREKLIQPGKINQLETCVITLERKNAR